MGNFVSGAARTFQQGLQAFNHAPGETWSETTVSGTPNPEPPPPPPAPDDQAIADAGAGQKKPKGRASTVLTGNYGLLGGGSTASRTLLGY